MRDNEGAICCMILMQKEQKKFFEPIQDFDAPKLNLKRYFTYDHFIANVWEFENCRCDHALDYFLRALKILFIFLMEYRDLFMRGELSQTTNSFQIELRQDYRSINFILFNFTHLIFDIVQNFQFINLFFQKIIRNYGLRGSWNI